ncbi:hypothetical protein DY000_02053541 [Brassica cretica]|uniref:Uncharacterized protein n=1 Tax=Brassica cretica TaxID=69181 RepID=A0ABQ7AC35_BRACR|nr:hypothetical protein DY000_02053541 [Brassica cretica]
MAVSTWPDISHLSVSRPELINVLRQMGQQDRVIHVISGGSKISGISHAAAKKSTWNTKHGLEAAKPKRLLLGTDEISFTAKEQEKVLTPHHDALVISLTAANCLVKRILVVGEKYSMMRLLQLPGSCLQVPGSCPQVLGSSPPGLGPCLRGPASGFQAE